MFEFAGDVSRKDVKNALLDVLEDEWNLVTNTEDNGMSLKVDIARDFTPTISLTMTADDTIDATFTAVPIYDDYDVVIGCTFLPVIMNAGLAEKNPKIAEKRFYMWYQFATVAKQIAEVSFYPFDYFD